MAKPLKLFRHILNNSLVGLEKLSVLIPKAQFEMESKESAYMIKRI